MATPRGSVIRLLESHPWSVPVSLLDAQRFHATLAPLMDTSRTMHRDDRIAKLVPLRLEVFLAHWPEPPEAHQLDSFIADAKGLCRHDIARLKELLTWAPIELPEQRTPRLGVPSLNTA